MVCFPSLFILLCSSVVLVLGENTLKLSRDDFPSDFVFGAGTSAYQYEGAAAEEGRTPSIWDTFAHDGNMPDQSNADVASDGYHKYKEDVKLISEVGLEAYRFSISWSRLLPNGRGAVNPKAVEYYNNLINELVYHGIELHATLCHLDLPQILHDEYEGWLSPQIVEDFTAFADVCFREFGDRISHWTTVNEPNIMAISSYGIGITPPQRCSPPICSAGNSSVEPYKALHHILLAHSSVVTMYKDKYQAKQNGLIGINAYGMFSAPMTNSTVDVQATQRANDFFIGWVIDPIIYGDYPEIMKKNVGSRMPSFTKQESELLKGSFDFIGLNHYLTIYAGDGPHSPTTGPGEFLTDMDVKLSIFKEETLTKEETPSDQFDPSALPYNPSGMEGLLEYFKDHYGNPPVYVQENGYGGPQNETLNDTARIDYLSGYLEVIHSAISNGANAKGYFVWSFLDVFEFINGYGSRYGLVHVDFEGKELKRHLKSSAHWYSNFLKKKTLAMKISDKSQSLRKLSRFSQ